MRKGSFGGRAASRLCLWACFLLPVSTLARAEPTTFVLAANESYGVEDCLLGSSECGQTVADAWCEAHGVGNAIGFGTNKLEVDAKAFIRGASDTIAITCGE